MSAPIALFVYNRPEHTRRTVEALRANELASESALFIFADGAKDVSDCLAVAQVRTYIGTVTGFKSVSIKESLENKGLAASIIAGVSEVVDQFGRVIVLEDDLVTSPYFLQFMNDGLERYASDSRVASIHGYVYPAKGALPETFFIRGADCWGWATWKRAWDLFESDGAKLLAELKSKQLINAFDLEGAKSFSGMLARQVAGTTDSWAIRWHASMFLRNMLTLYPGRSLVDNIGQDGSGTHQADSSASRVVLADRPITIAAIPVEESPVGRAAIKGYLASLRPSVWARLRRKMSL